MDNRYSELVREVVIDNFSEYIQTTAKVRPIPFIKGKTRIPLKYQNDEYEFRQVRFWGQNITALVKKSDGLIVPTNSKAVDKPRIKKVNGQDVYNQNAAAFGRAKIVDILHNYFEDHLKSMEPLDLSEYPLHIEMLFYIHDMGRRNVDNDNKWIWMKTMQDTLTKLSKIPDDNVNVIARNSQETILIPEDETQKLIIKIYKHGESSSS